MPESKAEPSFAVCVINDDCDDLLVGMLYRVLPDDAASAEGLVRVIDDSGEDYLYSAARFVLVDVPKAEVPRLLAASSVKMT